MRIQAEAEALVTLLREFPDAKAWVTFSCKVRQLMNCCITMIVIPFRYIW